MTDAETTGAEPSEDPAAAEAAPEKPAAAGRPPNPREPAPTGPETIEQFGRPMRIFPVAVSADVMAQAWANKEAAPQGAAVVVEHEINPRGLHGAIWGTPPADTLACAVVLRPTVSAEEGDVTWLVGGLAAVLAAEAVTGNSFATWWPDAVVELEFGDPIAACKSDVQLGPGQVKSAVVTVRFDLPRLELDPKADRDRLLEAFVHAVDEICTQMEQGADPVAKNYSERCALLGKRAKVRLRPKGETRGILRGVDRAARLEVESMSGMIERVGVNQLMDLEVVERKS